MARYKVNDIVIATNKGRQNGESFYIQCTVERVIFDGEVNTEFIDEYTLLTDGGRRFAACNIDIVQLVARSEDVEEANATIVTNAGGTLNNLDEALSNIRRATNIFTYESIEPVVDSRVPTLVTNQIGEPRITTQEYLPIPGRSTPLYSFRIRVERDNGGNIELVDKILTPRLAGSHMKFFDENNVEWVTDLQYGQVRRIGIPDDYGVRWAPKSEAIKAPPPKVMLHPITGKPRRKIYRKHPVPIIKEENEYIGKDYIA